ncbi:MAG TPA: DegV family protein [Acidimicrobiales bacterium]|nr:DegV family protein [Acidimicrobiales bacterium]
MASIQVVTDSACDLTPATTAEHDIIVVPLTIRFGAEELVDVVELSVKEFWDRVVTGPDMPATAAPSPGAFQEAFERAASAGHDGVLCLTLSSGLSATYQAARTAAEAVASTVPVRVIDTQSVTMGQGLLALAAADMAARGDGLDAVAVAIDAMRARTHVYGVLGGLDYLKRGGRIGGAAHLVGSLLSIKPVVEVRDGKVEVESKQRTRARSLQYLANKALEAGPIERLAVANGAAPDIDVVLELVRQADPAVPLVVGDLGPVVGSPTGPATVGVCFISAPA